MLIVFGGSFDPVHRGHLAMADAAQEQLDPELLIWVPSRHAPHKPEAPPAEPEQRLAFLRAVVETRPGEEVSDLEMRRPGLSYTIDTLEELSGHHPEEDFAFLLGGDALEHLPTWRDLPALFRKVEFLFVPREGWGAEHLAPFRASLPVELDRVFRARFLTMEPVQARSTTIRAELAAGRMPDAVPTEVARLIRAGGCYGYRS